MHGQCRAWLTDRDDVAILTYFSDVGEYLRDEVRLVSSSTVQAADFELPPCLSTGYHVLIRGLIELWGRPCTYMGCDGLTLYYGTLYQ